MMDVYDLLKNNGLKRTEQRIAILKALSEKGEPMTENEIKAEMPEHYDRITLYRTIQTLLSSNIIHRITVDNISMKYALSNNSCVNHIHFYCNKCHKVSCLGEIPINLIVVPDTYKTEECEVLVKGICDKCRGQENQK